MPLAEHFSAGGGMRFCIHTEKFMRVLGTNHDFAMKKSKALYDAILIPSYRLVSNITDHVHVCSQLLFHQSSIIHRKSGTDWPLQKYLADIPGRITGYSRMPSILLGNQQI